MVGILCIWKAQFFFPQFTTQKRADKLRDLAEGITMTEQSRLPSIFGFQKEMKTHSHDISHIKTFYRFVLCYWGQHTNSHSEMGKGQAGSLPMHDHVINSLWGLFIKASKTMKAKIQYHLWAEQLVCNGQVTTKGFPAIQLFFTCLYPYFLMQAFHTILQFLATSVLYLQPMIWDTSGLFWMVMTAILTTYLHMDLLQYTLFI